MTGGEDLIGENHIKRGQLRGYIFEVIIRVLLKQNGWRLVSNVEYGRTRLTSNYEVEIKGRGSWHQIDTPCTFSRKVPFMYPLRLLAEVKYYKDEVQKDSIRAYIGVIKDISENYFIDDTHTIKSQRRYTDVGVFFSAKGFNSEAVNLAFAHGIKTISYRTNPLMRAITDLIYKIEQGLSCEPTIGRGRRLAFMSDLENLMSSFASNYEQFISTYDITPVVAKQLDEMFALLQGLQTSFFGTTASGVFLHFISQDTFPTDLFSDTDEQRCRIYFTNDMIPVLKV